MILNIQALRAMAAMFVLLYHAIPHYAVMDNNHPFIVSIGQLGFMGVDIFFVISGFVIATTTTNRSRGLASATKFVQNRAARIYLGYWPFLFLIFTVFLKYDSTRLQNYSIFESLFLYTPNMDYILQVAWSLTYELYFYLLFIPLFWLSKNNLPRCMLVFFIFILLRSLIVYLDQHTFFGFVTTPYLLEFLGGSLLFHYQDNLLQKRFLPLSIAGILIGLYVGHHFEYEVDAPRVYSYGLAALCLAWLFLFLEKSGTYVFGQFWSELGDASYTIYLSHVPLLYLFYFSGLRDWLGHQHPLFIAIGFIAVVFAIVFFSVQFYYVVEQPLYKKVHRK